MGSVSLITGCRQAEQQALQQYGEFLADAFEVAPLPLTPQPFPTKRSLTLANLDRQLTLLESLTLKQCDLLYLASDKNQILNKHQSAASNYVFQLSLLNNLTHCLNTADSLSLSDRAFLTELTNEKQQKLPLYFWQMLFADSTGYDFFFGHCQLFPLQGHQFSQASLASLRSINQLNPSHSTSLQQQLALTNRLNQHLALMSKSRYLPSLIMTTEHAISQLDFASELLASNQASISCQGRRHPLSFDKLKAIFSHRYVALMQPYIATLNRELHQVMPLLSTLMEPMPPSIDQHTRQSLTQILNVQTRLTLSSQRHQQQWQQLFTRCQQSVTTTAR